MSGFTLVDFTIPTREVAMTHPAAEPPLCEDCRSLDLCFFNPLCPGCQDILLDSKTTIPELFAVMRQWVPQTQRNMPSLTREVLRRGANINDKDGLTDLSLLHYACKSGAAGVGNATTAVNLVNSLISKGADTNVRCRWTGMNAMHYAVYFDALEIVRVLAEQNPSLVMSTCPERSHGTPLHLAAANLSLDAGKILLQNGADGSAVDSEGRKPYEVLPENVPREQADILMEFSQLLRNAAENPPQRKRVSSRRSSPAPSPAPLVISRQEHNNNHNSKSAAAPAAPKSPAPSNNSTISTTSTQLTGTTGNLSSRTHSPAVTEVTMAALGLKIGDRVVIDSASAKPKHGTIRFGGATEFRDGQWAGVELDSEIGKNDGSYGGIRYFSCKPKYGVFVPMHRISKDSQFLERRKRKAGKIREEGGVRGGVSREEGSIASSAAAIDVRETRSMAGVGSKEVSQVGERVYLSGNRSGILRFTGPVKFAPGVWVGVELDGPTGKNDGSRDGARYFRCPVNHGVFVPYSKVKSHGSPSRHRRHHSPKKAASTATTSTSSGAELTDYSSGSGSVSLGVGGGASGASEVEGPSPSPQTSPATGRKHGNSNNNNRSGSRSKQSIISVSRSSASSGGGGGNTPDITLAEGMSVFVNKEMGTVKFIGSTEFAEGVWLGVELRKPAGRNDGTVQGRRYFHCKPNYGLFVKPEKATHRGINCAKILPKELMKS